jgi:hypothetical protein
LDQSAAGVAPAGTRHTFQCKRVHQFGPRNVDKAIADHTRQAAKKFILLSRIASPRTRDAVQQHPGWDLWDKEDISRRVRTLPREQQLRLVTTFFPQHRAVLLGNTAEGRWQTIEEFFAPYMAGRGAFSHDWPLIGRADELAALLSKLEDDQFKVVLLTGTGGGGYPTRANLSPRRQGKLGLSNSTSQQRSERRNCSSVGRPNGRNYVTAKG